MCGPLAAASAAAMAGGVLANKMGADEQASARNKVLSESRARQQAFQQQATDKFNSTLPLAGRENSDKTAGEAAGVRKSQDQALLSSIGASAPVAAAGGPKEVGDAYRSSVRDSGQRGLMQADANAKVGGVMDANHKLGIDLTRSGEWQRIFGSNMAHDAALVPGELNNANYAGGLARGIGKVLGAAGQAAGMAGMMGGGPTWGSLFGAGGGAPVATGSPLSMPHGATEAPGFFRGIFG